MLEQVIVDPAVYALRPDFAVLLVTAEGLVNAETEGSFDPRADAPAASDASSAEDPHVAAWHAAYRAFGANPRRARPSVDALLRRGELPGINEVVDAYNTVSVRHGLPIGGEDLDAYQGPARLVRAAGDEPFDTVKNGEAVIEHPEPGEVIWRDDAGVTCRRWNWRQCTRTRITERTKNALFMLERLEPYPLERLHAAGEELAARLRAVSPDAVVRTRLIIR